MAASLYMDVFWIVAPCSLVEVLAASETSANFHQTTHTQRYTQKSAIF